MRTKLDVRHDLALGRAVGSQLVGHDAFGRDPLLLQQPYQKSLGCPGVAPGLHDLAENITILINRAPKPMLLAINADHHFVQMPHVRAAR